MNSKHHRTIAVFTTTTFAIGSLSLLFLPFNLSGCASTKKVTALEERLSQQENRIEELQNGLRVSQDEIKRLKALPKTAKKAKVSRAKRVVASKPKRAFSSRKKVTAAIRRRSEQHYLSGIVYFQKGDYKRARTEWSLAKTLNPKNTNAKAGLERLDDILGIAKKPLAPGGAERETMSLIERKRLSQQHYLKGVILFQKGDYATARDEWKLSKYYDPKNDDAQAGLRRLKDGYTY